MTMATIKRVVIYYLLLELNHDNGYNKESSIHNIVNKSIISIIVVGQECFSWFKTSTCVHI